MIKEMYLKLSGVDGRIIQNSFWSQYENSSKVAIFYPGYRYPTEAPLFHFLKLHFLSNGWSILALEYRYNENIAFLNLPDAEQTEYLSSETKLLQNQLESQLKFDRFCFVSKSLGTTIAFKMLENDFALLDNKKFQYIWLTPADSNMQICDYIIENKIPSIYIIGDADPYYDEKLVSKIKDQMNGSYLIVPKAGHLFNHGEDLLKTMFNNQKIIEFLIKNIMA